MNGYLILAIAAVTNAVANIFIKAGASKGLGDRLIDLPLKILTNWQLCIGLFFFGLAFMGYVYALQHINLSIGAPMMTGISSAIILAVSLCFFNESFSAIQIAGLIFAISGVCLMAQ